jgi:hypothetical protein
MSLVLSKSVPTCAATYRTHGLLTHCSAHLLSVEVNKCVIKRNVFQFLWAALGQVSRSSFVQ